VFINFRLELRLHACTLVIHENTAGIVPFGYSVRTPLTKLRLICINAPERDIGLGAWKDSIDLVWQEITPA
jgi:hypothetical protein